MSARLKTVPQKCNKHIEINTPFLFRIDKSYGYGTMSNSLIFFSSMEYEGIPCKLYNTAGLYKAAIKTETSLQWTNDHRHYHWPVNARGGRKRVRAVINAFRCSIYDPLPPRSRLLSILGYSINFRIDGAPTPALADVMYRHEIYSSTDFANFASGYGQRLPRDREKSDISGDVLDGIFKSI